jgi:hypothetical protein
MKRNLPDHSDTDREIDHDPEYSANPADEELDLQKFEQSSAVYNRRLKNHRKLRQADWWIAAGLYLILVSVALVVL